MSRSARLIWACFLVGLLGTFLIVAIGDGAIAALVFAKREAGGGLSEELELSATAAPRVLEAADQQLQLQMQPVEPIYLDGEPRPAHLRTAALDLIELGVAERAEQQQAGQAAPPVAPTHLQQQQQQQRHQRQQQPYNRQRQQRMQQHYQQEQQQQQLLRQQQQLQQPPQTPLRRRQAALSKLTVEEHVKRHQQPNANERQLGGAGASNHERPFDVAQIQCNNTEEGFERFACPTPDSLGRYRCIEDRLFCDGYYDCPGGEDEDRVSCMYYKLFVSHVDILTNTFLTWMKKQNRQSAHRHTLEVSGLD